MIDRFKLELGSPWESNHMRKMREIKTHNSELRGQEEVARPYTQQASEIVAPL